MKLREALIKGLTATTAMTLYSYLVSYREKKNFKEPLLLAKISERTIGINEPKSIILGWLAHYGFGAGWAIVMVPFLTKTKPGITSRFGLSILSGVTGVVSWKFFFNAAANPSEVSYATFYRHLLAAHCVYIFSLNAVLKRY